jgi:imidazolonepropionase-like amidohydrolase
VPRLPLAILSLLLAFGGRAAAQAERSPVTILANVTVVDVERGVTVPDQDVVLRGGRIIAVRPARGTAVPAGARRIPLSGRFLIPGLWDMHTHATITAPGAGRPALVDSLSRRYFFALFAAHGVTGIRDLGGNLEALDRWRASAETASDVPVPRILATGRKMGTHPVVPGAPFPVVTASDVDRSVRLLRQAGADHVKLGTELSPALVESALGACRREGLRCASHVPVGLDLTLLNSGMSSLEHLFLLPDQTAALSREQLVDLRRQFRRPTILERIARTLGLGPRLTISVVDTAFVTHSRTEALRVFGAVARTGSWMTPTLGMHRKNLRAGNQHDAVDDGIALVPKSDTAAPAEQRASIDLRWRTFQQMVREMRDAGVGLLAGTDSPADEVPGSFLHTELVLLQEAGLTPVEALRTATLNPARYLGAIDSLGTVAPGRVADLVVLRANPLLDVAAVRQIEMVVSRGRVLSRPQLDALMETALRTAPKLRESLPGGGAGLGDPPPPSSPQP